MKENYSEELKNLRIRAGYTMRDIAKVLGYANHSSYQRYETQYSDRPIPLKFLKTIIPYLVGKGRPPISQEELLALGDVDGFETEFKAKDVVVAVPSQDYKGLKLPVYDIEDSESMLDGNLYETEKKTVSPINENCIQIPVMTDALAPRLRFRDKVFVDLKKIPERGQECVFFLKNGQALVREFETLKGDYYLYKQYSPEKTDTIALKDVDKVCAIVARA